VNEASADVNKENTESKVEPKQASSDIRPKEGWPPKPSVYFIQICRHNFLGTVRTYKLLHLHYAVSEAVPVQNQAAAQKLLQKMAMPEDRHGRGHRFKGKNKQDDAPVFTLEEWERRKAVGSVSTAERHIQDTSRDEELARQLQEQLDMEDSHVSFTPTSYCFSLKSIQ
jgi:tudor domain-containing protein 3